MSFVKPLWRLKWDRNIFIDWGMHLLFVWFLILHLSKKNTCLLISFSSYFYLLSYNQKVPSPSLSFSLSFWLYSPTSIFCPILRGPSWYLQNKLVNTYRFPRLQLLWLLFLGLHLWAVFSRREGAESLPSWVFVVCLHLDSSSTYSSWA